MTDAKKVLECLRIHASKESDCDACAFYDAETRGYHTCSEELAEKAADALDELLSKQQAIKEVITN